MGTLSHYKQGYQRLECIQCLFHFVICTMSPRTLYPLLCNSLYSFSIMFMWYGLFIHGDQKIVMMITLSSSTSQEIVIKASKLLLSSLRWRHNGPDSVSNHQPHECLLNRLFRHGSKKTSKFRVTGLCAGNSPGTGEFPAQMASYAENVSIWWRHHVMVTNLSLLWPPGAPFTNMV